MRSRFNMPGGRPLAALAVACAIVLVGCSGGGGSPSATLPAVASGILATAGPHPNPSPAPQHGGTGTTPVAGPTQAATPTQSPSLAGPSARPTVAPTGTGTATPAATPSPQATSSSQPTATPTPAPTAKPTATPTAKATAKPTATPTPAPTPTPTPTNVAYYDGCQIFGPGFYNADVSQSAPDANSASYIASVVATDNTGFYASTGIEQVNIASANTPLHTIVQKVPWHTFPVPEPWQGGYYIEHGGDGHSMVLLATPPKCHLYELYSTSFSNNVLSAYSGANWDLSTAYQVQQYGSDMASGLSLFAGMVKHEEIASGIHHSLNFSVWSGSPCNCWTAPASDTDGIAYAGPPTQFEFPYGGQLRLKASFDDSRFGPQAKAVTTALKRYGMYLADTGGHYSNNNALYFANPTDGGSWDQNDLGALGSLRFTDFDVMPVGQTFHH